MKSYSSDLRQRIVEAYEQGGGTILEVAESFSINAAFYCCTAGAAARTNANLITLGTLGYTS